MVRDPGLDCLSPISLLPSPAFSHLQRIRLTHVRQKPRMRRPALGKVRPRLAQAQRSVHREPHIGGILILLPVVLPPANRAQLQSLRARQRPVSATWTAILVSHVQVDGFPHPWVTPVASRPSTGFSYAEGGIARSFGPQTSPTRKGSHIFTQTLCKNSHTPAKFTQNVCCQRITKYLSFNRLKRASSRVQPFAQPPCSDLIRRDQRASRNRAPYTPCLGLSPELLEQTRPSPAGPNSRWPRPTRGRSAV